MPGIDECLLEAMTVPGARGAALVDWTSGLALGVIGDSPVGDHETTAAETAELARAAAEYESFAQDAPSDESGQGLPQGLPKGLSPGLPGGPETPRASPRESPPASPQARPPQEVPPAPRREIPKGPPVEDVIVTTRTGYHVLCFVETAFDSSVFLHLWLDRPTGNLALARIRLRDLAERLVLG